MPSKKLENRVAVITGATSGMALATAKLFVEEGAYVFITCRRQEMLDKAVKEIGKNNVTGVQGDAGKIADLDHLFAIVKNEKGRIDVRLRAASHCGSYLLPVAIALEKGVQVLGCYRGGWPNANEI